MGNCVIWKYPLQNYFDGETLTPVDKIEFTALPIDSFPVFDFATEEVFGIARYKPGEFAPMFIIDSGEISAILGKSVYNFFMEQPRKNKFLIGMRLGDTKYWGTFTQQNISFSYNNRNLTIMCRHILDEAKEQIEKSFVGMLAADRTVEDFLIYDFMPGDVYRLDCNTSFNSYASLIGEPSVMVRRALQIAGGWVNTLDVWQQLVEFAIGTGLNWDITTLAEPLIAYNFINFRLQIFSLDQLANSGITLQVMEAGDKTLFNKLEWLFMKYRRFDFSDYGFSGSETEVWDGVASDGTTIYNSDTKRQLPPISPVAQWCAPGFLYGDTVKNRFTWIPTYPPVGIKLFYNDKDTKVMDIPVYSNSVFGLGQQGTTCIYARIVAKPYGSGNDSYNNLKVQEYAINQYKRYIGFNKRVLEIKAVYDPNNSYKLWQKVNINEGERTSVFYVSRIQNLNYARREIDLTLIEY